MRTIILVLILAACQTQQSAPSPSQSPAPTEAAKTGAPPPRHARVERVHPVHTFDLLSEPVAPGASTTQTVTLADGWTVTDKPRGVGEGSAFVIDSAEVSADKKTYTVKAHNAGKTSARFVADVPCSGCP